MVFLAAPYFAADLEQEDYVVLEESQASKAPMKHPLWEKLRSSEMKIKSLETALGEKDDLLVLTQAEHARELRDKEIKNNEIVRNLQEQLDEARGQLYGGQPQSVSGVPEPNSAEESEYRELVNDLRNTAVSSEILDEAVAMANNKNYQGALVHLDTKISATDSTKLHANATLLKSCILRLADDPKRGLELAEHVVYIANLSNLPRLLAKAQLYRGLCLDDLGLYADALRCYVRAASVRWVTGQITHLTSVAEEKRSALPNGSRGKHLSPDFHEIPLSTSAKGFGTSPLSLE